MSNMSEISICRSDTLPPMLIEHTLESRQQRIRHIIVWGKDNGENIMKSINEDLSAEEMEMYKADIRATNILLQVNKDDRESQYTMNFEWNAFVKSKGADHIMLSNDVRKVKYNANNQGRPFQRNTTRGNVVTGNAGGQNRDGNVNPGTQWWNHVFEADQCNAFDSDVDEAPTTQTMFMANLTSEEAGPSYDSNTPFEPSKENLLATFAPQRNLTPDQIFWSIDENDRKEAETLAPKPLSALTVYPPNTPVKLVPRVLPTKSQVKINLYVLTQLFTEFDKTCKKRIAPTGVTEGERDDVDQNVEDKHCAEMLKKNHLMKMRIYCILFVESTVEAPDFNSFFKIKNLEHQIQEKDNVIRDLKVLVSNVNDRSCEPYNDKDVTDLLEQNERLRAEIEKVKQHYKEMFESIKITRTSTNEKTSSLLTQIEDLKAQLEGNLKVATRSSVKPKVLAPGMYAIDVKPIPHPLKNNRSAHLTYINHLKESVETVREIVEEARVVKPLDNALNYACQYTKLSQELLEYVIGTCPKSFNERDNKAPSTPVTRKKQVTFNDKPGTSSSNTQKHEVHQKVQQTNVPMIHSTGVNSSTKASGSTPRSNTKKNRILPAKTENKKKVEDHPRTN
ncbi:hypothetical protein Tco_0722131 [Tanacetum coccineum]